jgi:integrase/recombinase XerD
MHPALEDWSDWMRAAGRADRTIDTRTKGIQALCHHAGNSDPVSITTRDLIRWLGDCRTAWTRRTYAMTARQWFGWLVEQGYRADDPSQRMPLPPLPRGVPRPASTVSIRQVLEVASRRSRAYILLGTFEGLRVHEIAKVKGEDFDDGWLYVEGKGGRVDAIPVHPLVEQLRRGYPVNGYWFPGRRGLHVSANSVTQTIGRAFERAGYHSTAHQLRHWFGTHTQRTTKDSRITQSLMRHSSLESTQIYTEVADLRKVEAVRRLTTD